jgi:hypothetical protein
MKYVLVLCPCGNHHQIDNPNVTGIKPNRAVIFTCPTKGELMNLPEEPQGIVLRFSEDK